MNQVDLLQDLSIITTIPNNSLVQLAKKSELVICNALAESYELNEDITAIDIGMGTLYIKVESNKVLYQFKPALHFEKMILETVKSHDSPLIDKLEEGIKNRIISVYKDLL